MKNTHLGATRLLHYIAALREGSAEKAIYLSDQDAVNCRKKSAVITKMVTSLTTLLLAFTPSLAIGQQTSTVANRPIQCTIYIGWPTVQSTIQIGDYYTAAECATAVYKHFGRCPANGQIYRAVFFDREQWIEMSENGAQIDRFDSGNWKPLKTGISCYASREKEMRFAADKQPGSYLSKLDSACLQHSLLPVQATESKQRCTWFESNTGQVYGRSCQFDGDNSYTRQFTQNICGRQISFNRVCSLTGAINETFTLKPGQKIEHESLSRHECIYIYP